MAKPKITSIKPKKVESFILEETTDINVNNDEELEIKLNEHISNNDIHVNKDIKDAISNIGKELDLHVGDSHSHVTDTDKAIWNAKETPNGAQFKVNKVIESLNLHKADTSSHITQIEKESFKDKYTRAETRNLLKHSLTGLKFLESVNLRSEIETKYPNPEFNSCLLVKNENINLIFNGEKWIEFNLILSPEVTTENSGLMTKEDKVKLDSIEEGANNYIHPDNVDVFCFAGKGRSFVEITKNR